MIINLFWPLVEADDDEEIRRRISFEIPQSSNGYLVD